MTLNDFMPWRLQLLRFGTKMFFPGQSIQQKYMSYRWMVDAIEVCVCIYVYITIYISLWWSNMVCLQSKVIYHTGWVRFDIFGSETCFVPQIFKPHKLTWELLIFVSPQKMTVLKRHKFLWSSAESHRFFEGRWGQESQNCHQKCCSNRMFMFERISAEVTPWGVNGHISTRMLLHATSKENHFSKMFFSCTLQRLSIAEECPLRLWGCSFFSCSISWFLCVACFITLLGTSISHLLKRKIMFRSLLRRDILALKRVFSYSNQSLKLINSYQFNIHHSNL